MVTLTAPMLAPGLMARCFRVLEPTIWQAAKSFFALSEAVGLMAAAACRLAVALNRGRARRQPWRLRRSDVGPWGPR